MMHRRPGTHAVGRSEAPDQRRITPRCVLQRILGIAHDYFHLRNVAIALLDQQSQQLYIRSQIGWDEGQDKIRFPLGQGITGAAALKKQPVYSPDVSQDPRYICSAKSTRSELAIPLMVRDEVVGVLDCQSDRLDHFDCSSTDERSFVGQRVEELGEDGFCCEQTTVTQG